MSSVDDAFIVLFSARFGSTALTFTVSQFVPHSIVAAIMNTNINDVIFLFAIEVHSPILFFLPTHHGWNQSHVLTARSAESAPGPVLFQEPRGLFGKIGDN